jgi:hypothetical protein
MSKVLEAIKEKQYYDKEQDLWVVSVNHVGRVLTPPTADEVCKALSEYEDLDKHSFITYLPEDKTFTLFKQVAADDCYEIDLVRYENNTVYVAKHYTAKTFTLIGRFYEGLEAQK